MKASERLEGEGQIRGPSSEGYYKNEICIVKFIEDTLGLDQRGSQTKKAPFLLRS